MIGAGPEPNSQSLSRQSTPRARGMAPGALAVWALLGCDAGARAEPNLPHRPAPSERGPGVGSALVSPGSLLAMPADGEPRQSVRPLEPCLPQSYEVCFNALDDNCNGAIDEGCGTPAGVVQFIVAWDASRADVDLNVTDPNGELIEAGRATRSGLVKGRDCPGRRQECAGINLENVFLEGNKPPTRGTYRVSIALETLGGDEPPIWVSLSARLGPRRYAFEIMLREAEEEQHLDLSL
jgi:hypothetical protein